MVLAGYPQQESMTPRMRALAAALIDRQIVKNKSAEVKHDTGAKGGRDDAGMHGGRGRGDKGTRRSFISWLGRA